MPAQEAAPGQTPGAPCYLQAVGQRPAAHKEAGTGVVPDVGVARVADVGPRKVLIVQLERGSTRRREERGGRWGK